MKTTDQKIEASAPASVRPASVSKNMNQLHRMDFRKRFFNRGLPTAKILRLLYYEAPRLWELAEVVGKWVWIEFKDLPPRHVTAKLSELGFHWNTRRQLWQHPCGEFQDPRQKYHAYFPSDRQAA